MTNNEIIIEFVKDYHDGMKLTVEQLKSVDKELDCCFDWIRFFGKIAIITGIIVLFLGFWVLPFQWAAFFMGVLHTVKSIPAFRKHGRLIKKLTIKDEIIIKLMIEVEARHAHATKLKCNNM